MQKEELEALLKKFKAFAEAHIEEEGEFAFLLNNKYNYDEQNSNVFENNFEWNIFNTEISYTEQSIVLIQIKQAREYNEEIKEFVDIPNKQDCYFGSLPYDAILGITNNY